MNRNEDLIDPKSLNLHQSNENVNGTYAPNYFLPMFLNEEEEENLQSSREEEVHESSSDSESETVEKSQNEEVKARNILLQSPKQDKTYQSRDKLIGSAINEKVNLYIEKGFIFFLKY